MTKLQNEEVFLLVSRHFRNWNNIYVRPVIKLLDVHFHKKKLSIYPTLCQQSRDLCALKWSLSTDTSREGRFPVSSKLCSTTLRASCDNNDAVELKKWAAWKGTIGPGHKNCWCGRVKRPVYFMIQKGKIFIICTCVCQCSKLGYGNMIWPRQALGDE